MTFETIAAPTQSVLKRSPLYKVMLFDDDVGTFRCGIDILVNYFVTTQRINHPNKITEQTHILFATS
jgi:ATP-dependent Clp protease adapter protein ClpS